MKIAMLLETSIAKPTMIYWDGTGKVKIAFPNGDIYQYLTGDGRVGEIKRRYARNAGQMVKKIEQLTSANRKTPTLINR
jgi:hypothetical protein